MFTLDLGNLLVHLGLNSQQYTAVFKKAEEQIQLSARRMEEMGAKLTAKLTLPLLGVAAAGLSAFGSMDKAMANSLAIFSNVSDGMRRQMRETALDLSTEGSSTATELAKAYLYLGSAGYNAEQSLRNIVAVEKMATAGSFDLSTAVTLAADSQKALGMASADAEQNYQSLTRIIDVLVGANKLANATTQQFAEALSNEAAAAMKTWNVRLEEGVGVLAAYAEQGNKGMAAGSDFGRMLRLLMKGFGENKEQWERFGLTIYDVEGKLRPIADIIEDLTNELATMSPEAKYATLTLLGFEARSQQVILPLLGTADAIRGFTKELDGMAGTTERIAQENLNNFVSKMSMVWKEVKRAAYEIGETMSPRVLILGEYVRNLTKHFENMDEGTLKLVLDLGMMAALAGSVMVGVGKLTQGVILLTKALWANVTAATAFNATMASIVVAAAAWRIGTYLYNEFEWVAKAATYVVSAMWVAWESLKYGATLAVLAIKKVWAGLKSWFYDFAADLAMNMSVVLQKMEEMTVEATGKFTSLGSVAMHRMGLDMRAASKDAGQSMSDAWEKAASDHQEAMKHISEVTKATLADIGEKFKLRAPEADDATKAAADAAKQIEDAMNKAKESIDAVTKSTKVITPEMIEAEKNVQKILEDLDYEKEIIDLVNQGYARGADIIALKREAMKAFAGDMEKVNEVVDVYKAKLEELEKLHQFDRLKEWFQTNDLRNIWKNLADDAAQGLDDLASTLTDFMVGEQVEWKRFCANLLKAWLETINRMLMQQLMTQAIGAIGSAIGGAGKAGAAAGTHSGTPSMPAGTAVAAYGQVFHNVAFPVERMQMGGIIPVPTIVPMTPQKSAYVAEENPEAVVPLTKTRGRLGVYMEQGPAPVVKNNIKFVYARTKEELMAALRSEENETVIMATLKKNGVI